MHERVRGDWSAKGDEDMSMSIMLYICEKDQHFSFEPSECLACHKPKELKEFRSIDDRLDFLRQRLIDYVRMEIEVGSIPPESAIGVAFRDLVRELVK